MMAGDSSTDIRVSTVELFFDLGYAFVPILGGVVVLAAGVKLAIVRFGHPVTAPTAWFLAGGVALYVAGLAVFRRLLVGPAGLRLLIAGIALPIGIVGLTVSPQAQLAALVALLVVGIVADRRRTEEDNS